MQRQMQEQDLTWETDHCFIAPTHQHHLIGLESNGQLGEMEAHLKSPIATLTQSQHLNGGFHNFKIWWRNVLQYLLPLLL